MPAPLHPDHFSIRGLSQLDLERVSEILIAAHLSSPVPIGSVWSKEQIGTVLEKSWGLFVEERLRAVVLCTHAADILEVVHCATDPELQRHGFMRALLNQLLQRSGSGLRSEPFFSEIWLEVHEGNLPAQKLYEQIGFQKVGYRTAYYPDGGAAKLYSAIVRK